MGDALSLLRGKKVLIFDFDGTVADTSPLHAEAFRSVLSPLGIAVNYESIAGLKTYDALLSCLSSAGYIHSSSEIAELVDAKQLAVRHLISRDIQPVSGVDAFLRRIQSNIRLAMVTSGSRNSVMMALDKLGYSGLFDPLICAEDVEYAKPHPEGFLKVLKLTNAAADDALVFEDSAAGIMAAAAAGISCINVNEQNWLSICEGLR